MEKIQNKNFREILFHEFYLTYWPGLRNIFWPATFKENALYKREFFFFLHEMKGRKNNFYIWHLLRWTNWIITILFLYHMSKHTKTIFFIYFIVLQLSTRSKLITINVKRFSSGWPLRVPTCV